MKKWLFFIILSLSFKATSCAFDGAGLSAGLPQHPGSLTALMNISLARQSNLLPENTIPEQMLVWQLAQQLRAGKPNVDITFYQAVEGHYSRFSSRPYSIFESYPDNAKPNNSELMVISEFDVFAALFSSKLTLQQAIDDGLFIINGPASEVEEVKLWLQASFSG